MDLNTIRHWQLSLSGEISSLESEIRTLTAECERKRQQLELVTKLIASTETQAEPINVPSSSSEISQTNGDVSAAAVAGSITPAEVKAHVEQILADAKRPMKIAEIHAEFIRRGYAIPGKGTPFNILVHISREMKSNKNAKFVWAARGTYALREMQPSKRKNSKAGQEG